MYSDRPRLFSCGSGHRASLCASTALDALVSVDLVLAIAFLDCVYRASLCASTASNALIGNLVCHFSVPPLVNVIAVSIRYLLYCITINQKCKSKLKFF
jgi:hypothetical protein